MRARRLAFLLAAAIVAGSVEGVAVTGFAVVCENPGTPDCPVVTVTPGSGHVGIGVKSLGSLGSSSGQPGSGVSGGFSGSSGSGGSGGQSGVVPVANTGGGAPAP